MLSDPVQRMVYDDIHGYSATATNPFMSETATKDHAFVDEFSCIGAYLNLSTSIFLCVLVTYVSHFFLLCSLSLTGK